MCSSDLPRMDTTCAALGSSTRPLKLQNGEMIGKFETFVHAPYVPENIEVKVGAAGPILLTKDGVTALKPGDGTVLYGGPGRPTECVGAVFSRKRIELKTPDQVRHMRRAGLVVSDIHTALHIWCLACALAVAMTDASKLSDLISRAICRICVCVTSIAPRRLITCRSEEHTS